MTENLRQMTVTAAAAVDQRGITGAQALVEMLIDYKVEVIFGVPGDTSQPLYQALYDARTRIRHIMARDERSATFMADAYARLAYRPGFCECPSGAGALYSVPGVAEANASSIPVILMTSGIPLAGEGKGTITEMAHDRLFEPITKFSSVVHSADKLPETLRRALRIATTGRPGAAHLVFPTESMTDPIRNSSVSLHAEAECRSYPAYRTRGSATAIRELAAHLVRAARPVIVAGGGVTSSRATGEVLAIAERLGAPVVTTITGQGVIPDEHPLSLGVIGDNGFHPHACRAVEEADVLLYVGCKMGSVSTIRWTLPSPREGRKILQIDLDPTVLGNNFENAASVAGDAQLVLQELGDVLPHAPRAPSNWVADLNRVRARFWRRSEAQLLSEAAPLRAERVIHEVNRRLPAPAIVISDAGTPTPYITRYLRLRGGGSRILIPRAFGGLGYAIPAVVGAWTARPDARPIGLFGDGSFGMSVGELETLARLNVPAVLIHFNNACFGWIKTLQALHSGSRFLSVDFSAGDMSKVASAYGIASWRVETPAQLERALDDAFAHDGPAFLDIVTAPLHLELPPVYSWLRDAGQDPLCDSDDSSGR
jgi:acetolactate synthase-1/2/3 large subunit